MILSYKQMTKVLISLYGCAGWSAPLFFRNPKDRFSRIEANMVKAKDLCLNFIYSSSIWLFWVEYLKQIIRHLTVELNYQIFQKNKYNYFLLLYSKN